jgi:alditol oxidase
MMDTCGEGVSAGIGSFGSPGKNFGARLPSANWAGNVIFGAARVQRPESIDSLRRIVDNSNRIKALGRGHSFSGIADTAGELVLLDGLPKTLTIDPTHSTVTVPSGMSYTELTAGLHQAGFALANMASIPQISIAGACATGTHGSGDGLGVLATSVAAMQLVISNGDLLELRRDLDRDTFDGTVVALGALGIVTQLTLDIEPAYEVSQHVYLSVPLEELQGRFDDVFSAGYSVSAFTNWYDGEARVWVKRRVDQPVVELTVGSNAQHKVHPVPGTPAEWCTEQLGVVGPWHKRLPHFRPDSTAQGGNELQSEVFLPRNVADQAITTLREISSLFVPALLISEIRTVGADDLWLSPAHHRDSVAFHFTWTGDESAMLPALGVIEERLMPLDPRPHWGKLTTMTPRKVISAYERAPDFERLMLDCDPTFKFRNEFVNALFPIP